jgi:hypothetical protein
LRFVPSHPSGKNKDAVPDPEGALAPRWGTHFLCETERRET